jgi:spore protease
MNLRTDLADESIYDHHNSGILEEEEQKNDIKIKRIKIVTEDAANEVGKPMGNYITLDGDSISKKEPEIMSKIAGILAEEIKRVLPNEIENILIVGLGNRNITPDSLGPMVTDNIMVTSHIMQFLNNEKEKDFSSVSAVSPGVMGITGIETVDIIKGIVSIKKPSLIIAIDALCAQNAKRMFTTIQITDTGINPGSGVGNRRDGLNKETLQVPVIAIGIPTVIDANSIIYDALFDFFNKNNGLKEGEDIINSIIDKSSKTLIVSPKDIDNLIERSSKIVANGINLALHKNIDIAFIQNFVA